VDVMLLSVMLCFDEKLGLETVRVRCLIYVSISIYCCICGCCVCWCFLSRKEFYSCLFVYYWLVLYV